MSSHRPDSPPAPPADLERYLARVEDFHGHISPGLVLGGFLALAAWQRLGPTPHLNAVAETVVCLPDAVQVMTGCTLGNGFLQVLDWGKFALTLYDRATLQGVRAHVLREQAAATPKVAGWFLRSPHGEKVDKEEVVGRLLQCGPSLVGLKAVTLPRSLKPIEKVGTHPCPACGESFPTRLGERCPACTGGAYYE